MKNPLLANYFFNNRDSFVTDTNVCISSRPDLLSSIAKEHFCFINNFSFIFLQIFQLSKIGKKQMHNYVFGNWLKNLSTC